MLGAGPILWRRAFSETYPRIQMTGGPPTSRRVVFLQRLFMAPRTDGIPRHPASGRYYWLIDSFTTPTR